MVTRSSSSVRDALRPISPSFVSHGESFEASWLKRFLVHSEATVPLAERHEVAAFEVVVTPFDDPTRSSAGAKHVKTYRVYQRPL